MKQLKNLYLRVIIFATFVFIFRPTLLLAQEIPSEPAPPLVSESAPPPPPQISEVTSPPVQQPEETDSKKNTPSEEKHEPQSSKAITSEEINSAVSQTIPLQVNVENSTNQSSEVSEKLSLETPKPKTLAKPAAVSTSTQSLILSPSPTPSSSPAAVSMLTPALPISQESTAVLTPTPSPITTPTQSPTPSPLPSMTPTSSPISTTSAPTAQTVENNAQAQQTITATNTTGNNSLTTSNDAALTTGAASAVAVLENTVNTTTAGTNTQLDTINQTTTATAPINLSATQPDCQPPPFFVPTQQTTPQNQTEITNAAQLHNAVQLTSDTGQNSLQAQNGTLQTGDANTTTTISNIANTTLLGDCWYFGIVNVFAPQYTNLILPNNELFVFSSEQGLDTQLADASSHKATTTAQITVTNDATIQDSVSSQTNTGGNFSIGADITTGQTSNTTQIIDTTNQTRIGSNWFLLTITNPQLWKGNLLLADYPSFMENDRLNIWWQAPSGMTSSNQLLAINNTAQITNEVTAKASTGNNLLDALLPGSITTGDATTTTKISNLANTTAVGDNWYWMMLNLFDDFAGDISIARPDLGIQAAPGQVQLQPGQSVTITILVTNSGQSAAQGITAKLTLPSFMSSSAGTTLNISRLEADQSHTITTTLTLDPTFRGSVTIPITVTTHMTELSKANNQTSLSLSVIAPQLVVRPQVVTAQTREVVYVIQRPPVIQRLVQYIPIPQARSTTKPKPQLHQQLIRKPQVLAAAVQTPLSTPPPRINTKKTFCQNFPQLCNPANMLGTTLATSGLWWWNRKRKPVITAHQKIYWDEN